jgi:alpha-ketoglutarate-dependent taurine dioxygenase
VSLSKREQAALDFAAQVRERTTNALLRYFFSHGVYVVRDAAHEDIELRSGREVRVC